MRRAIRPAVRESDLSRWVRKALDAANVTYWRVNVTSVRGRKATNIGMSDYICVQPGTGRFVGLELKLPGEDLRESQVAFRDEVLAAGGVYIVATSAEEALSGIRNGGTP